MAHKVVVTEQQLASAHADLLRKHPDWAPSLAEALAHPVRRRLVRAMALGLALRSQCQPNHPPAVPRPTPAKTAPYRPPPAFDHKRAAAGDFDEPQLF